MEVRLYSLYRFKKEPGNGSEYVRKFSTRIHLRLVPLRPVTVIDCLLKLHVSKRFFFFFVLLEVKFGCGHGSSTKIKTADIERIMCATVVTFKKKHTAGGSKISFGRYARAGDRNKFV